MFVSFGCAVVHVQKLTLAIFCIPYAKYIEDIQVFGVNMSFISLSEVKNFYIS